MGLSHIHKATHSLYLKHVYNGTVADTFWGNELFRANMTIHIKAKVDNEVKRVHKLSTESKATVGYPCRGGSSAKKRGGARRRGGNNYNEGRQQHKKHRDYDSNYMSTTPPAFNRYNGGASNNNEGLGDVATTDLAHGVYVDRQGIRPSNTLYHKHRWLFSPWDMFKSNAKVKDRSSPRDVFKYNLL